MRVLASSVLVMEALTMGFALLIAMNSSDGWTVLLGAVVAILLLLTPGLLKKRSGWILGSILQFFLVGYGVVVTMMYFLGGIFALLWVAAIFVGRAGEAARARLTPS